MASKSFEKNGCRYVCKDLYATKCNGVLGRFWQIWFLSGGAWVYEQQAFFKNNATRSEITAFFGEE